MSQLGKRESLPSREWGPVMLLNSHQYTGQSQNVNSAEVENAGLKEASRVQIMKGYGVKSWSLAFLLRGVRNHSIWWGIGIVRSEF